MGDFTHGNSCRFAMLFVYGNPKCGLFRHFRRAFALLITIYLLDTIFPQSYDSNGGTQ